MPLIDEIVTTTLKDRKTAIHDAIFTGVPFFQWLMKKGSREDYSGGSKITEPIEYARNSTSAWLNGNGQLNTDRQTVLTLAEYDPKYMGGTVTITLDDMAKNSGKNAIIRLAQAKERNLISELQQKLEEAITAAQPAAGADDLSALSELVDVDPTANPPRGAVGGIAASNTWWRNRNVSVDVDTTRAIGDSYDFSSNGLPYMRGMYNACSKSGGTDEPDFIFWTQELHEAYEAKMPPQLVLTQEDRTKVDLGFRGLQWKNAVITWSNSLAGGTGTTLNKAYFLNSRAIKLRTHPEFSLDIGPFMEPTDQKSKTAKVVWVGELVACNRKRLGVIEGFTV